MPETPDIVIDVRAVHKDYHGLRPLRIQQLEVRAGESVALLGFDLAAAEVLVNLITGATLPDTGEVRTFGRLTATIQDADTWLNSLDNFGIVGERAVVVDNMTVEENLTMPVTMELHDVPPDVRSMIRGLAGEVGLSPSELSQAAGSLTASQRLRLRLGRALGPSPRLMLMEHPNAVLGADELRLFASDYARIVTARHMTSVVLTADRAFARAIAPRVMTLAPATGALAPLTTWRRWFS